MSRSKIKVLVKITLSVFRVFGFRVSEPLPLKNQPCKGPKTDRFSSPLIDRHVSLSIANHVNRRFGVAAQQHTQKAEVLVSVPAFILQPTWYEIL